MRREGYDEGQQQLEEYNRYEDTLDVFLNIIIKRSPTIFVLINMTLMIWLVQTIFSSNLQAIPRSIYFFLPFLKGQAIKELSIVKAAECPNSYQKISLKTFPTVTQEHITNQNLTHWKEDNILFCTKKFTEPHNFTRVCSKNQIFCNGFCVQKASYCPITNIKWYREKKEVPVGFEVIYQFENKEVYAVERKNVTKFVVGVTAMYEKKCINDVRLYDKYDSFANYWADTQDCGEEGPISLNIFRIFDLMDTTKFYQINGIMGPFIDSVIETSQTYIGVIDLIKFKVDSNKCLQAELLSKNLSDYLVSNPIAPSFTQSLLVVCFIFFTGCWAWLIGFYCFEGKRRQKNMIVILMSIIELIVVAFTYSQNRKLFETEHVVREISECFENPEIRDMAQWDFGISSASPFLIIIYLCTSFLSLQLLCNFIDRCMYEPFYQAQEHSHSH